MVYYIHYMILSPLYSNNGKKVHRPFIKVYYFICASLIAAQLSCFADVSTSQLPDTTKATVIDDLSRLYVGDKIATPDYLFGTVVTNEMYDASTTSPSLRLSSATSATLGILRRSTARIRMAGAIPTA